MAKKRPLLPEEEDDLRSRVNPFEKDDEKDGVDLDDTYNIRNSFLGEDEEIDFPDDDDSLDADLADNEDLW